VRGTVLAIRWRQPPRSERGEIWSGGDSMVGILWTVAVIIFILWLLGFFVAHLGGFIHILLIIAIIVVIYNLIAGRRAV
jgi:hypothetical protein